MMSEYSQQILLKHKINMNQLNYMGNFITFYDFDFFDRMSSDVGVFLFKLKKKIDKHTIKSF